MCCELMKPLGKDRDTQIKVQLPSIQFFFAQRPFYKGVLAQTAKQIFILCHSLWTLFIYSEEPMYQLNIKANSYFPWIHAARRVPADVDSANVCTQLKICDRMDSKHYKRWLHFLLEKQTSTGLFCVLYIWTVFPTLGPILVKLVHTQLYLSNLSCFCAKYNKQSDLSSCCHKVAIPSFLLVSICGTLLHIQIHNWSVYESMCRSVNHEMAFSCKLAGVFAWLLRLTRSFNSFSK